MDAGVIPTPDAELPDPLADAGVVRPDAESPPPPDAAPPAVEAAFVWPVNGWVVATHHYQTGEVHTGSADLAVPYHSPVGAARAGTVVRSELTSIGGWLIELDHGDGYTTLYSHLAEAPYFDVGETVETNQVIGISGRTGRALRNGAHLHLAIRRDGQRLEVPGLDFGDWVQRGDAVPGDYAVAPLPAGDSTFLVEVTVPTATLRTAPDPSAPAAGAVHDGAFAEVLGSDHGWLRVDAAGLVGWLAQSAAVPAGSTAVGLEVTASSAAVREAPSSTASSMGSFGDGDLVTAFEQSGGWYRVLYGLPTEYGWVAGGSVVATAKFNARLRTTEAHVRAGPGAEYGILGTLAMFDQFVVLENVEGWYRIAYDGGDGWVPGWLTQGRL